MLKTSPLARIAALTGVMGVLACGQIPFSIPESDGSALHISPSGVTIETGANLQLHVSVAEGSERAVAPTQVVWSSSAPNTVAVSSDGVAIGLAAGSAEITAQFDGISAVTSIGVVEPRRCAPGLQVPIQCPVLSR